jgi:hypothetical protein
MLFDLVDDRDSEIFNRIVTLTLTITEQLIAAEPKVSRALTGSEVCRRRKEGPVEIGLRPEPFEKTRADPFQLCPLICQETVSNLGGHAARRKGRRARPSATA